MVSGLKGKKIKYIWTPSPKAPEGGMYKSKKILVGPGLGRDAYPNLREPEKPVVSQTNYADTYGSDRANRPPAADNNSGASSMGAPAKRPMPGGPKKMMGGPSPGGPKKMGGPAPGGPKKMMGGPGPGGPKKMMGGPGGPKKMMMPGRGAPPQQW